MIFTVITMDNTASLSAIINDVSVYIKWLNENQGVVGVAIFLITLFLGWVSGIFASLRRKPIFRLDIRQGPNFFCLFETGERHNDHDVHRIGIAIYLSIANIGSAASSIKEVHIGYRWDLQPISRLWFKNFVLRFWLNHQIAALQDFQVEIGENLKVYPFLLQRNALMQHSSDTFLEPGKSTAGVLYFEQGDSWGGCRPRIRELHAYFKVKVVDIFGKSHTKIFKLPQYSLNEARKYNPSFGMTLATLRGEKLPGEQILPKNP